MNQINTQLLNLTVISNRFSRFNTLILPYVAHLTSNAYRILCTALTEINVVEINVEC